MLEYGDYLIEALKAKYNLVEAENLPETLLAGKYVIGAAVKRIRLHRNIQKYNMICQNVFCYAAEQKTLDVFTLKHGDGNKRDFYINREIHFPEEKEKSRGLMREYAEKFILKNYDLCFIPAWKEIGRLIYPHKPIIHIDIEEARDWLYSSQNIDVISQFTVPKICPG